MTSKRTLALLNKCINTKCEERVIENCIVKSKSGIIIKFKTFLTFALYLIEYKA